MAILLTCPNCGERDIFEFHFGGEVLNSPAKDAPVEDWLHYSYMRTNAEHEQDEWWYHKFGCRKWFLALRDRTSNEAIETHWPEGIQA